MSATLILDSGLGCSNEGYDGSERISSHEIGSVPCPAPPFFLLSATRKFTDRR